MTNRDRNALRVEIGQASTRRLREWENDLLRHPAVIGVTNDDERWAIIDLIRDELAGREHDLADPSSGLGLHQPTGSR